VDKSLLLLMSILQNGVHGFSLEQLRQANVRPETEARNVSFHIFFFTIQSVTEHSHYVKVTFQSLFFKRFSFSLSCKRSLAGFPFRSVTFFFLLKLTFRISSQLMSLWKKPLNYYPEKTWDGLVGQKANLKLKKLKLLKHFKLTCSMSAGFLVIGYVNMCLLLLGISNYSPTREFVNPVPDESCKILLWRQMYIYSRNFVVFLWLSFYNIRPIYYLL